MKWRLLNTPMSGATVWSLAADPKDERVLFAGVGTPSTPALYRSTDGGETWRHRPMEIAKECPNVGIPRPTAIAIDPTDSRHVWGSSDEGETWQAGHAR